MLQRGGLESKEAFTWALDYERVILSQKRILGHIKVETQKVY
jgi:hypothetical protein